VFVAYVGQEPCPKLAAFRRGLFALSSRLCFPVAFRPLAFACWDIFSPLRTSAPLAVGLPAHAGPHRGYHVPHQSRRERGGCLLYSGVGGVPTEFADENSALDPVLPYQPSLRQPSLTEPQRRFTCVHPSVLSLARFAWMVPAPLGLHLLLHTRLTRSQPRMQRLGTGCGHSPGPCGHSTGATSCRTPAFEPSRSLL
jgi:hypothetical protein